ncbi:MAG: sigma-70 family RNA polymerase sigma factor [Bacteroidota bacterium]
MNQDQTIALYQPALQAIAMKMLRCKADAEDIVQETFIKWLSAEQEKIKNTKAYLIRAVTNNCINHLNALKKKKEQYMESFHWPEFIERFKEAEFTSDIESELTKAFHVLHHKLEPLERAVYLLKEAFDFDYKALQELLNKKQDHCRQLFCRAKKKIQEEKLLLNSQFEAKKSELLETFKKACDFEHASLLIAELRKDIADALHKKDKNLS